jgi:GR25 family glycosyltransferase involved in LPS biosynthesis
MDSMFILLIVLSIILLAILSYIIIYSIITSYTPEEVVNINISVCVINLARRRDRMIEFSKQYALPVKYHVEDAVDGKTLNEHKLHQQGVLGDDGLQSITNLKKGIPKKYHYELGTLGAIGCSLSHIRIWQNMVKNNTANMLVFEDDALVRGITLQDIAARLADLPKGWHIYMIGQPHTILEGVPIKEKQDLYRITRFCGTHAYIINLEAAMWLMTKGMLYPINQQIDSHLSELTSDHGLMVYLHLGRSMYGSFGGNSDIQTRWDTEIGRKPL